MAEDLPLVQADPGLLQRVLVNVLDNSLRHGGERGAVEITAHSGSQHAKLEVVDHGSGVPDERKGVLFEPFQRLDDHGPEGWGWDCRWRGASSRRWTARWSPTTPRAEA